MNSGLVHSELNYNFRLFAKTISSSAAWGFDRFRLFNSKWHTKIQVRRLDGSVVATQSFAPDGAFEHTFSFDLSGNVTNEEYSVYIAGIAVGQNFNQAYAWPTGYSATTGKNAELTYWDFSQVNIVFSGTTGRIRFENNPITAMAGLNLLAAAEVNFSSCQLDAETLADAIIGLDNSEISTGTFTYSGNLAAPAERALAAYNNLKNVKGWTLTGAIPAAATFEAETTAYLSAVGIPDDANPSIYTGVSNNGVWLAVNEYIQDLKAAVIYSKVYYNYLKIGNSAAKQGIDLIDPTRVGTYLGSWVFNKDGATANGTNCYFKAIVNPIALAPASNDFGFSIVVNTYTFDQAYRTALGIYNGESVDHRIQLYIEDTTPNTVAPSIGTGIFATSYTSPSAAFHSVSRILDTGKYYVNGVENGSQAMAGKTFPNGEMYEGASNWYHNGSVDGYIQGAIGISAYHKNLTASETLALSNAVSKLETALGRKKY